MQDGCKLPVKRGARSVGARSGQDNKPLLAENVGELLIEAVTDYAIFMLDPGGQVVSWNPGAQRIKGYQPAEIIGRHFSCFYTEEDRAAGLPDKALATASDTGRFVAEGWRVRQDGGKFWAMVVIDAIVRNGTLIGFAKVTRDLTERRLAQLQLEQAREQLFQAQKMEAVGQLTGGLAHDFNNLLTGISGSLELFRTRLAQGRVTDLDRYIVAAQGAASRAASLTHRLLAFARRQTLDPKPTDLNKLISGMIELVTSSVGPTIQIETVLAPDVWGTLCDPNQLENAVLNLCINGRDAMPDGGQLTIATENASFMEGWFGEPDLHDGDCVVISVTDTGVGMTPEVAARAFDPFFTTKSLGMGTGLGLSMIYGFARQSGGQVRIATEPGHGTTVRIALPRLVSETPRPVAPGNLAATSPAKVIGTVVVVDDEQIVRMLVAEVLSDLGYDVLEAQDAASGLKLLQSGAPIALLMTDIGLPGGMNGRQLADAARQLRPALKILFMTGYAESAVIGSAQLDPGMNLLTKPFAMETLASRIKAIMSNA